MSEADRIIFYTDCYLFGGSEKPIFEILTSGELTREHGYLLFYRGSKKYIDGMHLSWPSFDYANTRQVKFFDIYTFKLYLETKFSRRLTLRIAGNILQILYPLLLPFLFTYECLFLFVLFKVVRGDYVHINNGGYPGALSCRAACIAAKLAGKKYIIMNINNMADKACGVFERIIDFLVNRSTSVFITGSKASAVALKENRGFDKRIINIYHGIKEPVLNKNMQSLIPDFGEKVKFISMVARFEERKGHRYAILAFKKIIFRFPQLKDIKLFLIGDGLLLERTKGLVQEEAISEQVVFLGHRDNYMDYVDKSLFLLNPSLGQEDLPYIVIEAMSAGVPVIGTDVGGIPEEISHGVTGLVVPSADTDALASAMSAMLFDDKKRVAMGRAAKKAFSELFTKDRMVNNYLSLYRQFSSNFN